jgi:tRNA dimethylallyltransferase
VFEIIAVVGPTASGKSQLGIELASLLINQGHPAEVINADAMQLYRGLDIGTAKLAESERGGITHHLIDVVQPEAEGTVADYQLLARAKADELLAAGITPIFVGGSMFYLAAALDELDFDPHDDELRAALEAELLELGPTRMHQRLATVDAAAAAKIPVANARKVLRALEVNQLTGRNFRAELPEPVSWRPTLWLGVSLERAELRARIAERVTQMWQAGLLAEVAQLPKLSATAAAAIGYAQALAQLESRLAEAEAITETVQLTARYARRQLSWFRRDKRIHWLPNEARLQSALKIIEENRS